MPAKNVGPQIPLGSMNSDLDKAAEEARKASEVNKNSSESFNKSSKKFEDSVDKFKQESEFSEKKRSSFLNSLADGFKKNPVTRYFENLKENRENGKLEILNSLRNIEKISTDGFKTLEEKFSVPHSIEKSIEKKESNDASISVQNASINIQNKSFFGTLLGGLKDLLTELVFSPITFLGKTFTFVKSELTSGINGLSKNISTKLDSLKDGLVSKLGFALRKDFWSHFFAIYFSF